ncbi:MAG TPA: multiheme c-type cytochrome [Chthoniobacterales bacterium]|nr:multiheme c-type cytochrome [Chthoniobacterales bacterium]
MAKPSRSSAQALLLLTVLAAGTALTWRSLQQARREVIPPENRPIKSLAGDYVSSDSCRSCHAGNYASWHTSFHRTMTQVAELRNFAGDMDGLEVAYDGWQYRAERQGDGVYVRKRRAGETEYGAPRKVVLLTGSHTLQLPWLETGEGRTLEQFPFAYIIAEKMWAPVAETFLTPPSLKEPYAIGAWNGACMDCHVTQGRSRFVKDNQFDSRVAEFGIACEACHGEGREHIARNRNPIRRFALHVQRAADPTITNPAKLKGPESALACGQCHSVFAFNSMDTKLDFNRNGRDFRPGKSELGQRFVLQPSTADHREQKEFIQRTEPHYMGDRFWPDGMIRVTGREYNGVQASPCFRGGNFSCLSCHEMHPASGPEADLKTWRRGQLKPGMESDAACLQCHQKFSNNIAAHSHHAPESAGSRCYNCHMPHTTFGLLHAMRSHQVSTPNVQESVTHGRPNACSLCHLDKTLAWTAGKLHEWYNQPVPSLSDDDSRISAGTQWIMKGDAAQRVIVLWGMSWEPAQRAAGKDWLYPFLIYGLSDPYAAVRFVSWKSLQTLPGLADFSFTFTADEKTRNESIAAVYQKWWQQIRTTDSVFPPETTLDSLGRFQLDVFQRLRSERNQTPVLLAE